MTSGIRLRANISIQSSVPPAAIDSGVALAGAAIVACGHSATMTARINLSAEPLLTVVTAAGETQTGVRLAGSAGCEVYATSEVFSPTTEIPLEGSAVASMPALVAPLTAVIRLRSPVQSRVDISGTLNAQIRLVGLATSQSQEQSAVLYHWRHIGDAAAVAQCSASGVLENLTMPPWASVSDARWKTRTVTAPLRRLEIK